MFKCIFIIVLVALVALFIYGVGEVLILIDEYIYKKEKEKFKNDNTN